MKTHAKILSGLILLNLAVAGPVLAEAPPPPPNPSGDLAGAAGGPWGEHRGRFIEERLTQLHQALKLTSAQETDWKAFNDKIKEVQSEKKQARPDFEALRSLPAPERLQKMIDFGKVRLAGMEKLLEATKTFYATLTEGQRKTFDDQTPFGAHAPKWRHGGRFGPGGRP